MTTTMIKLENELIYKFKDRTIYKTYCPRKKVFGLCLQSTQGTKELYPAYTHIFNFDERGQAAAITQEGQFRWIDSNLAVAPMGFEDEYLFSSFYRQNAKCNCYGTPNKCGHCKGGIIRNANNFRTTESTDSTRVYEYESLRGVYRITVTQEPDVRKGYTYFWQASDLEDNLQREIDYKEAHTQSCDNMEYDVCLYEYPNLDTEEVFLKGYLVRVEVTDINISLTYNDNAIYFDL